MHSERGDRAASVHGRDLGARRSLGDGRDLCVRHKDSGGHVAAGGNPNFRKHVINHSGERANYNKDSDGEQDPTLGPGSKRLAEGLLVECTRVSVKFGDCGLLCRTRWLVSLPIQAACLQGNPFPQIAQCRRHIRLDHGANGMPMVLLLPVPFSRPAGAGTS